MAVANWFFVLNISILILSNFILPAESSRRKRLINGTPASKNDLKYVVAIFRDDAYRCTGGILDERHVLSAAHCVVSALTNGILEGRFHVVAGSKDLSIGSEDGRREIYAKKIYLPLVQGKHWIGNDVYGDIAVLKLVEPLDLERNRYLESLRLPSRDALNNDQSYDSKTYRVGGFGWDEIYVSEREDGEKSASTTTIQLGLPKKPPVRVSGITTRRLRMASLKIVDSGECGKTYHAPAVEKHHLCGVLATSDHGSLCDGDSGAPLVASDENVVHGVFRASHYSCDNGKGPSLFTRVASYLGFIKNALDGKEVNMHVHRLKYPNKVLCTLLKKCVDAFCE